MDYYQFKQGEADKIYSDQKSKTKCYPYISSTQSREK